MDCLGSLFINKFRIDKNCHHLSLFTLTEVYLLIRYILSHSSLVGNSNTCKWICTSTYYYIFHQQPKKKWKLSAQKCKMERIEFVIGSRYILHASRVAAAAVQEIYNWEPTTHRAHRIFHLSTSCVMKRTGEHTVITPHSSPFNTAFMQDRDESM